MNRLKIELEYRNWKQKELVKALSIDPCRISMHLNGVFPLPKKHQQKLCTLLDLSPEEVMSPFAQINPTTKTKKGPCNG